MIQAEEEQHLNRDQEPEPEEPERKPDKPRINPRLVFNDPDVFFIDLLLEQE